MSLLSKFEKLIPGLIVAAIGWFAAPYIKAKLEGTQLNGIPGIIPFWKHVVTYPVPLWEPAAAVSAVFLLLISLRQRNQQSGTKPRLSIVILPAPPPRWSIGAMKDVPYMAVHAHVRLAHTEQHGIEIVNGYLEGTEGVAPFPPLLVTGRYDTSTTVHLGVRPILAESGQSFSRKIILVDQLGNQYRTREKVRFSDLPQPPERFGSQGLAIACFFCGKSIAMQDLHESAAVPAHKRCVK